jgi:hypothetical protein
MSTLESLAIQPNIYYTVEEAAGLLRVTRQAMISLLESGRVHGVRIDQDWRVLGSALLDLTEQDHEGEASLVSDWLAASSRTLKEVWDNEEDSVYDKL